MSFSLYLSWEAVLSTSTSSDSFPSYCSLDWHWPFFRHQSTSLRFCCILQFPLTSQLLFWGFSFRCDLWLFSSLSVHYLLVIQIPGLLKITSTSDFVSLSCPFAVLCFCGVWVGMSLLTLNQLFLWPCKWSDQSLRSFSFFYTFHSQIWAFTVFHISIMLLDCLYFPFLRFAWALHFLCSVFKSSYSVLHFIHSMCKKFSLSFLYKSLSFQFDPQMRSGTFRVVWP